MRPFAIAVCLLMIATVLPGPTEASWQGPNTPCVEWTPELLAVESSRQLPCTTVEGKPGVQLPANLIPCLPVGASPELATATMVEECQLVECGSAYTPLDTDGDGEPDITDPDDDCDRLGDDLEIYFGLDSRQANNPREMALTDEADGTVTINATVTGPLNTAEPGGSWEPYVAIEFTYGASWASTILDLYSREEQCEPNIQTGEPDCYLVNNYDGNYLATFPSPTHMGEVPGGDGWSNMDGPRDTPRADFRATLWERDGGPGRGPDDVVFATRSDNPSVPSLASIVNAAQSNTRDWIFEGNDVNLNLEVSLNVHLCAARWAAMVHEGAELVLLEDVRDCDVAENQAGTGRILT